MILFERLRAGLAASGIARPVRDALLDALAVVAPVWCSGCGEPDRAVCTGCRRALRPQARRVDDLAVDSAPLSPVWFGVEYAGVVRSVLRHFKDGGRTDAAGALADPLRSALGAALRDCTADGSGSCPARGGVRLATIPSTRAARRTRGYDPVGVVLRRAGLRADRVLMAVRETRDQALLGAACRARNRAGSLRAAARARGRHYVIVDDIVTTGSTLREAERALIAAGATVHASAAIAHAVLQHARAESSADPPPLFSDIPTGSHYGGRKGVDDSPFVIRAGDTSDQGGSRWKSASSDET